MAKKGMARPDWTQPHPKKVYHEKPIPYDAYKDIDTDLARDNLENDIPFADLQDL